MTLFGTATSDEVIMDENIILPTAIRERSYREYNDLKMVHVFPISYWLRCLECGRTSAYEDGHLSASGDSFTKMHVPKRITEKETPGRGNGKLR